MLIFSHETLYIYHINIYGCIYKHYNIHIQIRVTIYIYSYVWMLTHERHEFELHDSTYTWIVFNSK